MMANYSQYPEVPHAINGVKLYCNRLYNIRMTIQIVKIGLNPLKVFEFEKISSF